MAKVTGAVRNLGKPVALAARYYAAGADELALLHVTSFQHSPLCDQLMLAIVRAVVAATVFVPLTISGGRKPAGPVSHTQASPSLECGRIEAYAFEKIEMELDSGIDTEAFANHPTKWDSSKLFRLPSGTN